VSARSRSWSLRHQVKVLARKAGRPKFRRLDKVFLSAACRAQKPRIGPVSRSFLELPRPGPPRWARWGIQAVQRARHLFREHCRGMQPGGPCAPRSQPERSPASRCSRLGCYVVSRRGSPDGHSSFGGRRGPLRRRSASEASRTIGNPVDRGNRPRIRAQGPADPNMGICVESDPWVDFTEQSLVRHGRRRQQRIQLAWSVRWWGRSALACRVVQ
jgi:hypothetical protein